MLTLKEHDFKELTDYIKKDYGIDLTKKRLLIEGRLSNMIIEKGFNNFHDYLDFIFQDASGKEVRNLINRLTTNHTFFMREKDHFDYFKNIILPYLEKECTNRDLRIWSAGCSSGEEPYTLAMIIADYFGKSKFMWDTKILATDISQKVLETAEKGIYTAEAMSSVPNYWFMKYFTKVGKESYQISKAIRDEVIYRNFNLMNEVFSFKSKFDVIFCRNVMIYFDQKTKMQLINKFYDSTKSGGYLFIGHSEAINKEETDYRYVIPAIYRKG